MTSCNKKVVVGLSGGVDSSVAAFLLKEKGYDVIGVTLDIWQKESTARSTAINDAASVAKQLNIPHVVIDLKKEFKENIIDYFAKEYMEGKTPNPCVKCNRDIKFKALQKIAKEKYDAEYIATGHYAKVIKDDATGRYYLKQCDNIKDQTYALCMLSQEELTHTLMPLGYYSKENIREIAIENNLATAEKKDSQEICFVEDNDYANFICENYNYTSTSGDFIDIYGNNYGKHKGIIHYTVGQRRGLNLSLKAPLYVKHIDKDTNNVVLCKLEDMFESSLIAKDTNYIKIEEPSVGYIFEGYAKIRYSAKKEKVKVTVLKDNMIKVDFFSPVKSITRGQTVVIYDDSDIICGATII